MIKDYVDWINDINVGIINGNSLGFYLKMMFCRYTIDNLCKFDTSNFSLNS